MVWSIKIFAGFLPLILIGLLWTLAVSLASFIFGLLLAVLFAGAELSPVKMLRLPVFAMTALLRGLPEIVVLFFCYFGGTIILSNLFGHYVDINTFMAGVLSLGLIFAAYGAQVFRAAFYQIPKGQFLASKALGFSKWQCFYHILLPQMMHHASPGLSNLWLSLLKDSSLVSLIGMSELMNNIGLAASATHQPFYFYALAAFLYLLLTSISRFILIRSRSWNSAH